MAKADNPRAVEGHNSATTKVARDQLKSFVERIERLTEERQAISDDIKDIYAEAKGTGFDVKVLRKAVARRKRDRTAVDEEDALLETYEHALGVFG